MRQTRVAPAGRAPSSLRTRPRVVLGVLQEAAKDFQQLAIGRIALKHPVPPQRRRVQRGCEVWQRVPLSSASRRLLLRSAYRQPAARHNARDGAAHLRYTEDARASACKNQVRTAAPLMSLRRAAIGAQTITSAQHHTPGIPNAALGFIAAVNPIMRFASRPTLFITRKLRCRLLNWMVSCRSAIQNARCANRTALCARTHAR